MRIYRAIAMLLLVLLLPGCVSLPVMQETAPPQTLPQLITEQITTGYEETVPETTAAPLPPEFSEPLPQSDTKLVVDGKMLAHCYLRDDIRYVCVDDVSGVICTTQIGEGSAHSCTLAVQGHMLFCTTFTSTIMEDHVAFGLESNPVFDGEKWYIPTCGFFKSLGYSEFRDTERDTVYYTHYPRNAAITAGKEIPVLMYHAVSDVCWGSTELFVSPSVLDEQIAALLENGYTPITFEDFDRLQTIDKPVMLTFDDGYDDNYDNLFPILQKYHVKATVFMIVNDIGKNHKLTEEEITEMSSSGLVSIQSHTMSHGYLGDMNEEQLDYEMSQSKLQLARLTGKEPFVLCYPSGSYSDLSLEKTAQYYEYGIMMNGGMYTTGNDRCAISRFYVPRGLSAEDLLTKIS